MIGNALAVSAAGSRRTTRHVEPQAPEILTERAAPGPVRSRSESDIQPTGDTGGERPTAVVKPTIEPIAEQAVQAARCQDDGPAATPGYTAGDADQSLQDHSAWFKYYLPEDSPPSAPEETSRVPSSTTADGDSSPISLKEQRYEASWIARPDQPFVADTSWAETISLLEMGPADVMVSTSTETSGAFQAEESGREETEPASELRTATLLDPGTPPGRGRQPAFEDDVWPRDTRHQPGIEPEVSKPKAMPDLPSAKDILAAVSMRPSAQPEKPSTRRNLDHAKPTEQRPPDQWYPHLWLVWPPTALLVIAMGIVGSLLSFRWSGDSVNASVVSQRLLARTDNPGRQKPLPESVVPPESSWWQTTSLHLAEWGIYLERSKSENDRTAEGRELVEAAVRISPISPMARLDRASRHRSRPHQRSRRLTWVSVEMPSAWPGSTEGFARLEKRNPRFAFTGRLCRSPASMTLEPMRSPRSTTSPTFAAISYLVKRRRGPSSVN